MNDKIDEARSARDELGGLRSVIYDTLDQEQIKQLENSWIQHKKVRVMLANP
jgi:hypothetical protein